MDIKLFSIIVKRLGDEDLESFEFKHDNLIYGFKITGDNQWIDDGSGKYQHKEEQGQLVEMDKNYKEIQSLKFGVSRFTTRSGSYFTGYNYESDNYEAFEIKEVLMPEIIIPAYIGTQWDALNLDLAKVVDEEADNQKHIENERLKLEESIKLEKDRLTKLYPMNNSKIIKMVNKNLKKRGPFSLDDMRKEYLEIVIKGNLESKEWIEYHEGLQKEADVMK